MDFQQYQQNARKTAAYTANQENLILYPALGLVGECGEVSEKAKKIIRDDNWLITTGRSSALIDELGDCCWYIANICCDLNLEMDIIERMINSTSLACITDLPLYRLCLKMNRHAILVASSMEKAYYEHDKIGNIASIFPDIPSNLTSLLSCIIASAKLLGTTIEEICETNIRKLLKRVENRTIHGDGDDR